MESKSAIIDKLADLEEELNEGLDMSNEKACRVLDFLAGAQAVLESYFNEGGSWNK